MNNYSVAVQMPTTIGRKKSKMLYPGTTSNLSSLFYSYKYKHVENVVGKKGILLSEIYNCKENDEEIILQKGILHYEILEGDKISFEEEWQKELKFNKSTLSADNEESFEEILSEEIPDNESIFQIIEYIDKIVSLNENVRTFFSNNPDILLRGERYISRSFMSRAKTILYNTSYSLLELEKMINAGQEKLLVKNLDNPEFKLEKNKKKLSQSVGLPPFALPLMKKLRIEDNVEILSKINEKIDGNSLKMLLELMDNMSNFLTLTILQTNKNRSTLIQNFFENIYQIILKGYNMKDVLNYVLRQRMYWNKDNDFGFPFEDTKLFLDYLELSKNNSLKCEKYPQNLKRMHDILVNNLRSYDEKKDKDFIKAVAKYKKYENELDKDGYTFITPKNIKDLIQEGNDLHHCIGSYVDKIIEGKSKIFFMRKISEKHVSFVTVELDDKCNIVEIKGMFNKDPEPEIISVAKKWSGICKRVK